MKTIAFIPPALWVRNTDPFYHSGFDIQPTQSPQTDTSDVTPESILTACLQSNLSNHDSALPFIIANSLPTGLCRAETLHKKLQTDLKQHPDTDLYLLTSDNQPDSSSTSSENWGFTPWYPATQNNTHPANQAFAFLILPGNRDKLINALRAPGQTLLSLAQHGHLTVRKVDLPIFIDHDDNQTRLGFFTADAPIPGNIRIAAYMPSYKRLEDLIRQTHCILSQSSSVDLYVAVKGFTKYHIENIIKPIFPDAIRDGRLHLDYYPNSNQLTNILDCLRHCDLSRYDLFAKIDDDDFYSPDYFEHVRNFHRTIPAHFSSFHTAAYHHYALNNGIPDFVNFYDVICSRTMVITRQVLDTMYLIEADPRSIGQYCDQVHSCYKGNDTFSFNEDKLIKMVMCEHGAANRAGYLREKGITRHVMAQSGNPSVLRSNYVDPEFRSANGKLSVKRNEHFIQLSHAPQGWEQTVRVFNRKYTITTGETDQNQGHVVYYGPDKLIIHRKGHIEQYEPDDNFRYAYNPQTSLGLHSAVAVPEEGESWRLLHRVMPRHGSMSLRRDRETVIASLLSVCPLFDKISIVSYADNDDDGSINLIKQFIAEGRNGNCDITIDNSPHHAHSVEHDTPYYHWASLSANQIYITHLLENTFRQADFHSLRGKPICIKRTACQLIPQNTPVSNDVTINTIAQPIHLGNNHPCEIRSRLDASPVPYETDREPSSFLFPNNHPQQLQDFRLLPELRQQFDTYIRPLLDQNSNTYANLQF